jgi:hypothetical protein
LAGTKVGKYPIGEMHFVTAIVTGTVSGGIWWTCTRWKKYFSESEKIEVLHSKMPFNRNDSLLL